jgi:hypothetical protein
MTRKLLPYEYDLIDTLGVSKEEYLDFLAVQQTYIDVKEGTALDVRNDLGITAIILAIIGILAQVASVLLAPKPRLPSTPEAFGQRQTRDQRFSPRFGFNSQQELAKYGDPINLVYTDTSINPNGGVRLAASLIWSAVRSYGSTQFVQMLMVLGASGIRAINTSKSAFGQTALSDITTENKWLYFRPNGTGALQWADITGGQSVEDPTLYGTSTNNPYRIQTTSENVRSDGFSQAYSPATQNSLGIYGVVPVNVEVYQRNEAGDKEAAPLGIYSTWDWASTQSVGIGFELTITIQAANTDVNNVNTQAQETRRALASTFDDSGIFKLGSAKFRVKSINVGSPDEKDMIVELVCIESGNAPVLEYASQTIESDSTRFKNSVLNGAEYRGASDVVNAAYNADQRTRTIPGVTARGGGRSTPTVTTKYSVDEVMTGDGVYSARYTQTTARGRGGPYSVFNGYGKDRNFTLGEQAAYTTLKRLDALIATYESNDYFYTKALTRFEEASYQTLQPCHIVDLAIKSNVSKQLSGRQERYGSQNRGGYPASDNGFKNRTSLFLLQYKTAGGSFVYAPGFFAISRTNNIENFNYIKFNSGKTAVADAKFWQFKLEPVADPQSELAKHPELRGSAGQVAYLYVENSGVAVTQPLADGASVQFTGRLINSASGLPPLNENPSGLNEWDLFNLDSDNQLQFSFDNGPEMSLTCVTEQLLQPFTDYPQLYNDLNLVGFNVFSGRNLQDLRSFTAFVSQGRDVRRLRTSGVDENNTPWGQANYNYIPSAANGATCYAPDIFLDSVLDPDDGIGKYAVIDGINVEQLARTKKFCEVNQLFMDGVIADPTSWREFWVQAAPFSLLEFARIGGRETLVPAVPYNPNTGELQRRISITALFNQGNILEDSYKEEYLDYGSNVQDLIASVIYRDTDINGTFARNRTLEVKLKDASDNDAIRQTFDLSQFVTTARQAILYAKLLCNLRRHVRRAIEFRTFPTQDPIAPGAFIYIDIGQNAWNGIRTGVVGPGGALNTPLDNNLPNGTYKFLMYRSGNGVVSIETTVAGNTANALTAYDGWLFVLGTQINSKRIFRVSEVQMDEEGEITVRASEYPCDTNDNSLIADFSDGLFTVTGTLN